MARYIQLLILTALVVFPACSDTDPVIHHGGTDGPISSYLDVELIRFGTDFTSVEITEVDDMPLLQRTHVSQCGQSANTGKRSENKKRDVEPVTSPTFAVLRTVQNIVDDFRQWLCRGELFDRRRESRRGRTRRQR